MKSKKITTIWVILCVSLARIPNECMIQSTSLYHRSISLFSVTVTDPRGWVSYREERSMQLTVLEAQGHSRAYHLGFGEDSMAGV